MRIGCLQFAPQVAEVGSNISRAETILEEDSLENLDLLVLPELALTGYNFKSLEQISPYLEYCGSGTTSSWAHTIAKKHDCLVAVGYPETVDITDQWPADPEYYNSAVIVDKHGDVLANYRKSFLYYTDETWALEGNEGFYDGYIPELGNIAYGICMDLNPYKFEAPWSDCEFGTHIVRSKSNVVIVSMAWMTREPAGEFLRTPKHPDLDTLTYWVTRLEPVLRVDDRAEIIVIFCNRCGTEDDVVYAGTSAVIGILDGEVRVYGVLGRGEEKILVVDTKNAPQARLVPQTSLTSKADENGSARNETDDGNYSSSDVPGPSSPPEDPNDGPRCTERQQSHQYDAHDMESTQRKGKLSDLHKLSTVFHNQNSRPLSLEMATPIAPTPTPMHMRPKIEQPEPLHHQNHDGISQSDNSSHISMSSRSELSESVEWSDIRPQDSASHLASAFDDDSPSESTSQPSLRASHTLTYTESHPRSSPSRDDLLIDFDTPDDPASWSGSETMSAVYRHGLSELHSPPPDYTAVVDASFRAHRTARRLMPHTKHSARDLGPGAPPLKSYGSMSDLRPESAVSSPGPQYAKRNRPDSTITRQKAGTPIQLPTRPQSVDVRSEGPSISSRAVVSTSIPSVPSQGRAKKSSSAGKSISGIAPTITSPPPTRGLGIENRVPSRTTSRPAEPSFSTGKSQTPDPLTSHSHRRAMRQHSRAESFQWPSLGKQSPGFSSQGSPALSRHQSMRDAGQSLRNAAEINRNHTTTPTTLASLSLLSKKQLHLENMPGKGYPAHWLDALEGTGLSKEAKARAEKEAMVALSDVGRSKRQYTTASTSKTKPSHPKADGLARLEISSADTMSPESPTTPGSALKTPKAMVLFDEMEDALGSAIVSRGDKRASVIRFVDRRSMEITS